MKGLIEMPKTLNDRHFFTSTKEWYRHREEIPMRPLAPRAVPTPPVTRMAGR
jgi:hypothetical protein